MTLNAETSKGPQDEKSRHAARERDQAITKDKMRDKMRQHPTPEARLRGFMSETLANASHLLKEVAAGTMTVDDAESYIQHVRDNQDDIVNGVMHGVDEHQGQHQGQGGR